MAVFLHTLGNDSHPEIVEAVELVEPAESRHTISEEGPMVGAAKRAHPKFLRKRQAGSGKIVTKVKGKKAAGSSKVVARFLNGLRSEGVDLVATGTAQRNVPLIVQRQLKKALAGYTVVVRKQAATAKPESSTKDPIGRLVGTGIPEPSDAELDFATKSEVAAILKRPDMVTAEELASRIGTTKETINQWRKAGRVIGVAGAKRGFRYPLQQLNQFGQPYEVIPGILRQLEGDHWAAWRFLLERVPELGMTGFEALAHSNTGRLLAVLEARSYGAFS
jgi:hypothetical protein